MPALHRFEREGQRYVIDPETCFCFACDEISWDVLALYPHTPVNRIYHLLQERYPLKELQEVVSELEWLRASKSILPPPRDHTKDLQVERGLHTLQVELPPAPVAVRRWGRSGSLSWDLGVAQLAAPFLLSRSQQQATLHLEFVLDAPPHDAGALGQVIETALRLGRTTGKQLTVWLHLRGLEMSKLPEVLAGHTLSLRLPLDRPDRVAEACAALSKWWRLGLGKLASQARAWEGEQSPELVCTLRHPQFDGVVQALDEAGFQRVMLVTDALFAEGTARSAATALASLHENASYYAERLLQHHYLRVEPFAALFLQIHNGQPRLRSDPAGTQSLSLNAEGDLYPSLLLSTDRAFRLGSLRDAEVEEAKLRVYDDVGALTTPGCVNCWGRSLCGGGSLAVHHALSGSFRRPHPEWCDAQRAWLEAAIAAFNTLASAGVNFARLHQNLNYGKRPSLFALAKAAFQMHLGVRPPEEADAAWLRRWENWNEAAYFVSAENSVLMATQYDREMDAVHPRGVERELILLRRDATPMGLLRLRPERLERTARMWLYFRNEADYALEAHRRSFAHILAEANVQQPFAHVLCATGPREAALGAFLQSLGFTLAGREREALYLHGAYQDLHLYRFSFQ